MAKRLENIRIEFANNGYTIIGCYRDEEKKDKSGYVSPEYDNTVHNTVESALTKLKQLLNAPNSKKGTDLSKRAIRSGINY